MSISAASLVAASAAQAQSTANLVAQNTIYSTNIAGKTYTANIDTAAGDYVATVPNHLPPLSASGSSLTIAENNLDARISLLA